MSNGYWKKQYDALAAMHEALRDKLIAADAENEALRREIARHLELYRILAKETQREVDDHTTSSGHSDSPGRRV